jgi:hypothetical protein
MRNMQPKRRQAWKKRVVSVEIKPDHTYSPREVAAVLSVSYDTALRIMSRMKRIANFAKPRTKKRLPRIKGSDLRDYIHGKLEGWTHGFPILTELMAAIAERQRRNPGGSGGTIPKIADWLDEREVGSWSSWTINPSAK